MKSCVFDMAPINPNVNNIYYDMNTYTKAIEKYFKKEMPLYDRYDNDTNSYQSNSHYIIGRIESIDLESRKITVLLHDCMQFITPMDYVIGFKLLTNGCYYSEDTETQCYNINSILYACIINKEFLK